MKNRGEIIFSTIVLLALVASLTLIGVKYMHNEDKKPPVEKVHIPLCDKKPDCKCELLEAGKVIIK